MPPWHACSERAGKILSRKHVSFSFCARVLDIMIRIGPSTEEFNVAFLSC